MNIQVDISKRVGWISDRVELCDMAKDYIKFQMKEAVVQALSQIQNIESEIVVSDSHAVEHGALHGVRNLECEADQSDVSENTNDAALEIRIDSENPKQKLVNIQTYKDDKRDKEIIEKVIRNTKSF